MDKWIAVTDEAEIAELTSRKGELDTPMLYAPNGQLWANADELRAWRECPRPL
jgi:hypothetical protein